MFYPSAMTEIELIVPSRDLLAVTKTLSNYGVFHQASNEHLHLDHSNGSGPASSWQEKAATYAALERRVQAIMQILNIDEGQPTKVSSEVMVEIDTIRPVVDRIEQEVRQTSDELVNSRKKLEQLEISLRQLEPVAEIDLDIGSLRSSRYLCWTLGLMPTANISRLQTSLERIPYVFRVLRQDAQNAVVWLAGTTDNADILDRAARSAYLNPLVLPEDSNGTPAEIIASLRQDSEATRQKIVELEKTLSRLGKEYKQELQILLWSIRASRLLTDAIVRFGRLRYTYLIVGWIPNTEVEGLTQQLKEVSKDALIQAFPSKRSDGQNDIPVALNNPKVFRPFQMLVTTYARPKYGEIDPTWLIALTFPVLFGAMFGDVGQGLVLTILGWLISRKKIKPLRSLAGLGDLIAICGVMATLFGFLYGSIFGFEHVIPALWMHPIENIMLILIIAIGAGVVLLSVGFILGIVNAWIARDWGHLIFDPHGIAGLVLYWSLLGLVARIAIPGLPVPSSVLVALAAISAVMIMFNELFKHLVARHRPLIEGGIGTYAIQAVFELFETVISLLSNSLSYVRVGAFAVAHAGLSQAIFILAALAGGTGSIGYWIVVFIGNLFIIGFEGLIVGIQTMRLSYYELFSKFFKGGGMRYEPLRMPRAEREQA